MWTNTALAIRNVKELEALTGNLTKFFIVVASLPYQLTSQRVPSYVSIAALRNL